MLNILLPFLGKSEFFAESFFPKPLIEIAGRTVLETVVDNYGALEPKRFIFIFPDEDCRRFHLDASARLLTPGSVVIKLKNRTAGALCTCLTAVDYIENSDPLIIANSDQIIDVDYREVLRTFAANGADGGVITFPSIHPRWSYAAVEDGEVREVAEKRPLSSEAVAGFYYYREGRLFVESAKSAIRKDCSLDGVFYISASLNEMILRGGRIVCYPVAKDAYHSFYSPEKIREYEERMRR